MGVEFSGKIEKLDQKSENGFKVGDEVFGLAYGGTSHYIGQCSCAGSTANEH
jgi:NADPH:quinone reductase-like Zn-dependent oxidoreductase